jgi:hypothetical protein
VAFFIHRDEITQLAKIHKLYLSKKLEKPNGPRADGGLVYALFRELAGCA